MNTTRQGALAEQQAAEFLTRKGHTVLARNFRTAGAEADIITRVKDTLVFVEVKQRSYEAFGGPLAAVTPVKQKRIARAANAFIKNHAELKYKNVRFDVICILPQGITHLENAFFPPRTTL